MKIGVPKESRPGEKRVALSPETAKKFVGLGFNVAVEKGAGMAAAMTDEAYREAGATVAASAKAAMDGADVVLKVQRPTADEIKLMKKGARLACVMSPFTDAASTQACAKAGVEAFAMEFMPRITRAQSMDVLSSQSNLAGYRAVIDAAYEFSRAYPMMMTAAGTVAPAKIFVMGAGVAGLQAVATAKRMGAVVTATDVRKAAGEQVESLGGKFIFIETEEDMETAGGYAKELSAEDQKRQAELVANHIKGQDIVITTALIPGRPAPKLVTAAMVESMKPGSVIIDLAVEAGGNCELSEFDKVVEKNGVKIVGHANWPSRVAVDASALYARNLFNFLSPLCDEEKGTLAIDDEDEIIKGTRLTLDGAVVHPQLTKVDAKPAAKEPAASRGKTQAPKTKKSGGASTTKSGGARSKSARSKTTRVSHAKPPADKAPEGAAETPDPDKKTRRIDDA